MTSTTLIAVIIAVLVSIAAASIYYDLRNMRQQLERHEKEINELKESARLRMPQDAMQYILNGMAALDALEEDVVISENKARNARIWFERALTIGTKRETKHIDK